MKDFIDYERGGYGFRDYFDADCDDLCHGDDEGVVVYEIDDNGEPHQIAEVSGKSVDDIEEMTEREFGFFLAENGVL